MEELPIETQPNETPRALRHLQQGWAQVERLGMEIAAARAEGLTQEEIDKLAAAFERQGQRNADLAATAIREGLLDGSKYTPF